MISEFTHVMLKVCVKLAALSAEWPGCRKTYGPGETRTHDHAFRGHIFNANINISDKELVELKKKKGKKVIINQKVTLDKCFLLTRTLCMEELILETAKMSYLNYLYCFLHPHY